MEEELGNGGLESFIPIQIIYLICGMQQYHKITSADLDFFIQTCGKEFVFSEESSLADYAKDHTEDLIFYPEVVVKPAIF